MLFQLLHDAPAETTGYMIAGYTVIFGMLLIYLVSLVLRKRNLEQDLEVLEDIQQKKD